MDGSISAGIRQSDCHGRGEYMDQDVVVESERICCWVSSKRVITHRSGMEDRPITGCRTDDEGHVVEATKKRIGMKVLQDLLVEAWVFRSRLRGW